MHDTTQGELFQKGRLRLDRAQSGLALFGGLGLELVVVGSRARVGLGHCGIWGFVFGHVLNLTNRAEPMPQVANSVTIQLVQSVRPALDRDKRLATNCWVPAPATVRTV